MELSQVNMTLSIVLAAALPIIVNCVVRGCLRKRRREEEEGLSFEPAPQRQRTEEPDDPLVPLVDEPAILVDEPAILVDEAHIDVGENPFDGLSDILPLPSPDPHLEFEEDLGFDLLYNEISNIVFSLLGNLELPPTPHSSVEDIIYFSLLDEASMEFLQAVRDDLIFYGMNSTFFVEFLVNPGASDFFLRRSVEWSQLEKMLEPHG